MKDRLRHSETQRIRCIVKDLLHDVVKDPRITVTDVDVETIRSSSFETTRPTTWYVITIRTNDPAAIRGDAQEFKGSYKERLEGALQFAIRRHQPNSLAHIDIVGPRNGSVERTVPISQLLLAKKLTATSPLVRTADTFGIPYALVRGRHLIGPSPAVADVLRQVMERAGRGIQSVLDVFSGTGLAAKVVCKSNDVRHVVCVDSSAERVRQLQRHLRDTRVEVRMGDACNGQLPHGRFDLVVADPYYEDVQNFLSRQLDRISKCTQRLVLVAGGIENISWNRMVLSMLRNSEARTKRHASYGQVIFESRW